MEFMQCNKNNSDKYKDQSSKNNETTFYNDERLNDEANTEHKSVYENIRIVQRTKDDGNGYETLQVKQNKCVNGGCPKERCVIIVLLTVCTSLGVAALVIAIAGGNKPEAVDGSWSAWSLWEACSTTCDVGMQIRHRNCSNPAPVGYGRQCLGVEYEQRLCMPGPCLTKEAAESSWSDWALWESCSTTCDVGMQIRRRNCTNPSPVVQGHQCLGMDNEQRLCMSGPCLNAGWSEWGSWGTCSASCNDGIRFRSRNCSNPFPSLTSRYCEGNPIEVISCRNISCKDDVVVFHASRAADLSLSRNQTIVFKESITNKGRSYNSATGIFTAPVDGVYQFSVHLCAQQAKNLDYSLVQGDSYILRGYYSEIDKSGTCTSFSVPVIVKQNEQVRVVYDGSTSTSDILYQDDDDWNTFSGVLIRELY